MMKFNTSMMTMFISIMLTISFFFFFQNVQSMIFLQWSFWIHCTNFSMLILLDKISITFLLCVFLISIAVMMFSMTYMNNESTLFRFNLLVMSFILSMMLLIISPNLISALLGWDLLGMTSYLLVIHYHSNKAFKSGMITVLTNRLGDFFFLILISLTLTLNFWNISCLQQLWPTKMLSLLIVLTAFTKSAQVPFSAWLPAAMAAPTPVSSLVHSSTLVTAGIYLLIRHSFYFNYMSFHSMILLVGCMTTLMASFNAFFENDLKKMVALSTLSQLGLMSSLLGMNMPIISFIHLINHAFFKALMFISTGSMMHSSNSKQEIRFMGSMNNISFTKSFHILANLGLMGLPMMSAFYTKELILELYFLKWFSFTKISLLLLSIVATTIYSTRFTLMFFFKTQKMIPLMKNWDNDNKINMSMLTLAPMALMSGLKLQKIVFINSSPLSNPMIYIMSIFSIILMIMLMLNMYMIFKKYKTNTNFKMMISMWALEPLNYYLTLKSFFSPTKIITTSDKIISKMTQFLMLTLHMKIMTKNSTNMNLILTLTFTWTIIMLTYYLNNKKS